jgi:hypothetical protein
MNRAIFATLVAAFCASAPAQSFRDQLPPEIRVQRGSGDSVQPVFDGWQRFADGTISMWFSYYNRNSQEQVDIPIGPGNSFNLGGADRGQPTHFYPKRHQYVFKVDLPKNWDPTAKLIWTLTAHGETCTATGWLQPEWEVDDGVRQMNAGGGGLAPPADPPNTAPKITGGSTDQTVNMGQPVKLTASATDDGIPKPRGMRGLSIRWILYRGPGAVTFTPPDARATPGQPAQSATDAAFTAPGDYWLQAIASDGLLETVHNVRVTVKR